MGHLGLDKNGATDKSHLLRHLPFSKSGSNMARIRRKILHGLLLPIPVLFVNIERLVDLLDHMHGSQSTVKERS